MYKNLDIVFLGGLFPKETEEYIIHNSIGSVQNAANNLQWEIVKGLEDNLDKPIKIYNSLYIGSYPRRYRKMHIKTYNFSHNSNVAEDINVGFLNLSYIKNISRKLSMIPYLRKWATSKNNEKKIIIAYAMTSTFTSLLKYVKKINSNIITCLIVPDLPQYMNMSDKISISYRILKNIEIKIINDDMKYIDSYVLLTKYMNEALNISVPYTVIEGVYTDLFENINSLPKDAGIKVILYSGGLSKKYGVIDLINSFENLSGDNYKLVICGSGEAEPEIVNASNRDKRIIFKGLLKREEVLKLQKSSSILINPRPNNDIYTKYSFPSKIIEYMSSGTPVVAYKLDGIPIEYYKYIYPVKDGIDGLTITLKEILLKTEAELKEKGINARNFVASQKNRTIQGEKILNMLNNI